MANEELTRSQYLAALAEQRRLLNANSSVYVNPSVPNQVDIQKDKPVIAIDFSYANQFSLAEKEQEIENIEKTEKEKENNLWTDIVSVLNKGFEGVFAGLEGIADLFGLIGIGIGDLFGADTSGLRETVELYQAPAYANFMTNWMVGESYENEDISVWNQPEAYSTLDTGFGRTVGDIVGIVGEMVPAIAFGGGSKIATLAGMGMSAAGQGGQEALNEGASVGQALGYGVVKGGIEVGTELVVGKALSKIPGIGKIFEGAGSNVNGVQFSKNIVKSGLSTKIVSTMIEEGAEEVASDLLAPIASTIYKGGDALKEYGDKEYWKGTLKSFFMGAVTGGIMDAGQRAILTTQYSADGVKLLDLQADYQALVEEANDARLKYGENSVQFKNASDKLANLMGQIVDTIKEFQEKHPKQFDKFWQKAQFTSAEEFRQSMDKSVKEHLDNALSEKVRESSGMSNFSINTVDESSLKKVKNKDGSYSYPKAFYDSKTNTVVVNSAYADQFGKLINHEVISHVVLDSNKTATNELVKFIESKPKLKTEFHKYDSELVGLYGKNKSSLLLRERLARFLENQLSDPKAFSKVFSTNAVSRTRAAKFLRSIVNKFAGIRGKKGLNSLIINKARQALNELSKVDNMPKRGTAFAKDKLTGKYEAGDNKLAIKVVKTPEGYDIYEKGKLVKEGLTASEVEEELKNLQAKKVVTEKSTDKKTEKKSETKKETPKPEGKGVIGKWLQNEGKDSMTVEKNNGIYQIFNENKKLLTEFKTTDQVRAYMEDAKATKYKAEKPKLLGKKFNIVKNKDIYVMDGNGEISIKRLIEKDGKWRVQTKALDDGAITESKLMTYKEARNVIDTFVNKSYSKDALEKFKAEKPQRIKAEKAKLKKAKSSTAQVKESKPEYFKSVATTKDIIQQAKVSIESKQNAKVQLAFPKNFETFASKTFTELNSVKSIKTEVRKVSDMLMESTLRAYDEETNTWAKVGKLNDLLSAKEKVDLESQLTKLITESTSEKAKSAETKPFEITIERIADKLSNKTNATKETRVLTNQRRLIKGEIVRVLPINKDNVTRNGLEFTLYPVRNLKGQTTFSQKGVVEDFNAVKQMYEEIGENPTLYPNIPYEVEFSEQIDRIIESIGEPTVRKDGKVVYGNMSAETERLINEYIRMARHMIKLSKTKMVENYMPSAMQTLWSMNSSSYGLKTDILSKTFRKYKRGFVPSYVEIRQMLGGNSSLAQLLTVDYQNAQNSKQIYVGTYSDLIKTKLKELGIKRQFNKRLFTINNQKLTTGQALFLYISSKVDANFEAINESGVNYIDEHGRTKTLVREGNAEALKTQIEKALPDNYKKLGDFLLDTMNDSLKSEYIEMYEARMGKYNHRNEIGKVKENKYWTLVRYRPEYSSVESAVTNALGLFSNAKHRIDNTRPVMIGDALSTFTTYVDKLATELYLKPIYRDALATINTQVGRESIADFIKKNLDQQDAEYIKRTMEDMVGALKPTNDIFTGIMSRFSVAKLSLNLGTMGKQFASIFTSNIPMTKSVRGFVKRWDAKLKAEYKILQNELGGLKYRDGKNVVRANADSLGNISEKIAEYGMVGITAVDKFTINTGVFSLMVIGQNEFGYEIGSQENIDFVKEQWHEFELSQIGSGVLSKNAISRGDYGALAKGLFSFLQGANRAALGSQINKIDLWKRNHKVVESEVRENKSKTSKAVSEYEESHKNKEGKFETADLTEEQQKKYIDLVAKKIDAEAKYKDFVKYKVAGGKAIPIHMAAGLIAQGVFVTLINELMKRIRGKKDWDEWELAEMGKNTALAIGVDWVPFVNTISSMIKGYDVQVPAVEVFKEIGDVLSNVKTGNWEKTIRQLAILIGDSTGIPFQTIYEYIYGAVKTFDVGTAEKMNSVFYGLTAQSATQTLNKYAKKGNYNKAYSMMNIAMDNFRVKASDEVKKELTNLTIDGQEVLPKQYMTSYKDENGYEVPLSEEQIKSFRSVYDESDKQVSKLIANEEYQSLDNNKKAALIKKVYDLYYEYAKYRVTGVMPNTKVGKLLALTNGNLELANYLIYLNQLGEIVATKSKTRKELALKYINGIYDMTKAEKLLLMALAGYSVAEDKQKLVINHLVSLGLDRNTAKGFIA